MRSRVLLQFLIINHYGSFINKQDTTRDFWRFREPLEGVKVCIIFEPTMQEPPRPGSQTGFQEGRQWRNRDSCSDVRPDLWRVRGACGVVVILQQKECSWLTELFADALLQVYDKAQGHESRTNKMSSRRPILSFLSLLISISDCFSHSLFFLLLLLRSVSAASIFWQTTSGYRSVVLSSDRPQRSC